MTDSARFCVQRALLLLLFSAAATGCQDEQGITAPENEAEQPTATDSIDSRPVFLRTNADECPAVLDFIATDEASLRAVLAAARPTNVIGVDGTIALAAGLALETEDITLTCATPGSGLRVGAAGEINFLLSVYAPGVAVSRLSLDGSGTRRGPLHVAYNGAALRGSDVRFTHNQVVCGPGECAFLVGTPRALVSDNEFVSHGSITGIHLQHFNFAGLSSPIDGSRIERNTLVASSPLGHPLFGAIRPRDGRRVVVADNLILGQWSNGIGLAELGESRIERNRVEGAQQYGLFLSSNPFNPVSTRGNLFRGNRISAGTAAIFARRACGNVIMGNLARRGSAPWTMIFDASTGANAFVGNGTAVLDNGDMDCDGDGLVDPNQIAGAASVDSGGNLGAIVADVMPAVSGSPLR